MASGLPDIVVACVGGGSNAAGIFSAFIPYEKVRLIGVEAGGSGSAPGQHAARFTNDGAPGIMHGTHTWMLQDSDGQILPTHSVSAGLDYAAIGPEHAYYRDRKRIDFTYATDDEVLKAFKICCRTEGIIPALESTHAFVHVMKRAREMSSDQVIVMNMSGRGDKDVQQVAALLGEEAETR